MLKFVMADVLIVDDSADLRILLEAIIEAVGHNARTADDGRTGLAAVAKQRPDIVLLDVEMPVLSGPEMAYELFLRDLGNEKIPIVLISGVVGLEDLAAAVGTPYFLSKPYSPKDLLQIVNRALREGIAPRPRREAA